MFTLDKHLVISDLTLKSTFHIRLIWIIILFRYDRYEHEREDQQTD